MSTQNLNEGINPELDKLYHDTIKPKPKLKLKKYTIIGIVETGKWLGMIEANSEEEALEIAEKDKNIQNNSYISLCHQCANELDDPQITELRAFPAN